MFVVTGGAGFIGANLVKALNDRGERDIVVVDNLERADKFLNLTDCEISNYIDKRDFIDLVRNGKFTADVAAIFHEGACSDTMEHNGRYMMDNNYQYTRDLCDYCREHGIPFIYASSASVYGGGSVFREERQHEAPLNVYGYSKFLFDQHVRGIGSNPGCQIAGFRYFNVYGPREQHKGRMASVAWHFFHQFQEYGKVKLFEGCDGYENGEQRRDFISVEDVSKVNLYFLDNPDRSGIFNVGTGRSQTFNDVAVATVNAINRRLGKEELDLEGMKTRGLIEYVDFPEALRGKYQSFTEADVSRLRESGYGEEFHTVESGVDLYVDYLSQLK